jgi:hypothetical protein
MNKWETLKEYVNSHEFITRKILHSKDLLDGSTSDNYINMLRKIGFIKRTAPGEYTRVEKIPEDLTSSKLTQIYSKDPIKYWRKVKLEKIKNIK